MSDEIKYIPNVTVTDKNTGFSQRLRVISGAGGWGFTDVEGVPAAADQLSKFIGKRVYLSGGGGSGIHPVILEGVAITKSPLKDSTNPAIRVRLSGNANLPIDDQGIFDPYIGSWQISVPEDEFDI